jgi:hypothetical protein
MLNLNMEPIVSIIEETPEQTGPEHDPAREYTLMAVADAAAAARRAHMWTLPTVADRDIPFLLEMAPTAWHQIKSSGEGPPLFEYPGSRRVYGYTKHLLAWVEQWAANALPGSKKQRLEARLEQAQATRERTHRPLRGRPPGRRQAQPVARSGATGEDTAA